MADLSLSSSNVCLEADCIRLTQTALEIPQDVERQKRIGILGGTFNPPHLGHLIMAEQVCQQLDLDEVWFMPTAKPPHAPGKQTIASIHRVEMVKRAIDDNPKFKLQAYEVNRGGKNYSIDTMRHLVETYPQVTFYFIVGEDSVNDLPTWKDFEALLNLVQFVGVKRPGYQQSHHALPVIWVDAPLIEISSTDIRLRVYLDQSIRYQVPDAVAQYIYQEKLYSLKEGRS